ncbi:hypothetical protein [Legionella oakridgensis]|uniref:hypothetical protein n=1 Tax=Legionella oakridgensis TaxID=29423 RepID=UPI0003DE04B1|nr:hypothetical protein [Legionella oakridgensis]ETO94353.1 outer membrane protein [Legionella oakridgensis RV-2-2007]
MKKEILATLTTLAFLPVLHAGEMGASTPHSSNVYPFVSLEGSYTWHKAETINIQGNTTTPSSTQPWGGRLAAGLLIPYTETTYFTGEIGYGYYGQLTINNYTTYKNTLDYYGLDLLVGVAYRWNQWGAFLKAGSMVQNRTNKLTQNLTVGSITTRLTDFKANDTQFFPEIKVGGTYNIFNNLALSLAYMRVFGVNHPSKTSITTDSTIITVGNIQNPALNTVMLGLNYVFK